MPPLLSRCQTLPVTGKTAWLVEIHPASSVIGDIVGFRVRFCLQGAEASRSLSLSSYATPVERMLPSAGSRSFSSAEKAGDKREKQRDPSRAIFALCRIPPRRAGGFAPDERGHKLAVTPRRILADDENAARPGDSRRKRNCA